jgi:hypothetical protein
MPATLCQQLADVKTTDRLCVIRKLEDNVMYVSYIIDEHQIATDVTRFDVRIAHIDDKIIYRCEKYGYEHDCPPFPLKLFLQEAAENDSVKFEAFLWKCERLAAADAAYAAYDAAVDAVYAAYDAAAAAAYAADAARAAAAAADVAYAAYAAAYDVAAARAAARRHTYADLYGFLERYDATRGMLQ